MERPNFDEAVKTIVGEGSPYHADAYHFLREALEETVTRLREDELIEHRHVSGPELLEGVVEHARKEFGSMAKSVLETWKIEAGEDIGRMVFQLIEVGAFGRSEEDSPADFTGVVDLQEELLKPYRPTREVIDRNSNRGGEPPTRGNQPARPKER